MDLEERLAGVCGELNAAHARLVALVVEALESGAWEGWGIASPAQWLALQSGLSPRRAREVVDIARRQAELPATMDAFAAGELAVDQVAAVAARVPGWADREVCDLARAATVAQLRRVLGRYRFEPVPPAPEDRDDPAVPVDRFSVPEASVAPVARCGFGFDDEARFFLHAHGDADDGALVEAALSEARDRLFHDGQPDVSWWDALVDIAQRSLDQIVDPARRDRYRLHVHIDVDGVSPAQLTSGVPLPDRLVEQLVCDGKIQPVWEHHGIPFAASPTVTVIPERIRRIVHHRDQGCRVPGCTATRWLQVHHIIHREHHGPTHPSNLVCLCPHHHRLHHQGKLGITGNAEQPDGLVFTDAHGRPIHPGPRPRPPTGPPVAPARSYHHPTGERINTHWIYFNPPRAGPSTS